MKRDLFRKYVWLIDTIRHTEGISFEDLSESWLKSPLNTERMPLALRTFHNHRNAIYNLFGIRVVCDRSNRNLYRIAGLPDDNDTKLKVWMVDKLSSSELDEEADTLRQRILIDSAPEDKYGLDSVIDAMLHNVVLKITCAIPTYDGKTSLLLAPYALCQWCSQWFILGKDIATGHMHALNLYRVVDISNTGNPFEYPAGFSPKKFLKPFFGMDIISDRTPEVVRLKISGRTRDEIRTLPLHSSQKEMVANNDFSVFEYFLIPSEKFHGTILSHGTDMEVLHPKTLRDSIAEVVDRLSQRYSSSSGQ